MNGAMWRTALAGAICVTILCGMLVGHAWPLWTGRIVVMEVVPVDPRDLFRGEYVRLDTPASRLPMAGDSGRKLAGTVVYAQLEPTNVAGGRTVHRATGFSSRPVGGAVNLRGRVRWASNESIVVDYGLDAFFMKEGAARPIEDAMRAGRQVLMEVAIADSGRARIRNLIVDGVPLPR
jgi:uncharacterized membrane-anchored protein